MGKVLKYVNIKKEHVHFLDGLTKNYAKECENYEKAIAAVGGVDLFIGGVGEDGHIAFNEPYSSLNSRTRAKLLTPSTIQANSRFFDNDTSKVPPMVLTIGIATMMDAAEVMILASGKAKALAVKNAVQGGVTHVWPVSVLQQHQHGILVCDEDATWQLDPQTVAYFKRNRSNILKFCVRDVLNEILSLLSSYLRCNFNLSFILLFSCFNCIYYFS